MTSAFDTNQTTLPARAELERLVGKLPWAAAITNCSGQLVSANPSLRRLLPEVERESFNGRLPDLLAELHPRDWSAIRRELAAVLTQNISGHFVLTDNASLNLAVNIFPDLQNSPPELRVWEFRGIGQDQKLQQHEAHAEKMGAISRLAGGLAHEFNNLLTAVLGNLELIRETPEARIEQMLSNVESAESAALRASHLIDELRRFASRSLPRCEPQTLVPIIRSVRRILSEMAPDQVEVRTSIQGDHNRMCCDVSSEALGEALLKIGSNAIESIGHQPGRVVIHLKAPVDATQTVEISLTDTGKGMCSDTRDMAFEPFFSTKDPTTSSGLGMSMAHSLIEQMGGEILIDESTSSGTHVKISFAALPDGTVLTGDGDVVTETVRPCSRIALVDNEPGILTVGRGMLAHIGHKVEPYAAGPDILDALENGAEFDLIILDNAMPGMSGRSTYARLRVIAPHVPVVICSGRMVDLSSFAAHNVSPPDAFLSKPFSLASLVAMLERTLPPNQDEPRE